MEKPVAPHLEDYSLTQATYALAPTPLSVRLEKAIDRERAVTLTMLFAVVALAGTGAWRTLHDGPLAVALSLITWGLGGLFGAIFIAIPLLIIAGILQWLEIQVFTLVSPSYRAARAYDRAIIQYQSALREYEGWLAKQREDYWRSLNGLSFEQQLAALFRKIGFEAETTPHTSDGGVDIILKKNGGKVVVQCKAHKSKVSIGTARELAQSMRDFGADRAIIACFEGLTKPAIEYVKDKRIDVLDVRAIAELQRRYG